MIIPSLQYLPPARRAWTAPGAGSSHPRGQAAARFYGFFFFFFLHTHVPREEEFIALTRTQHCHSPAGKAGLFGKPDLR